jgi:arylsulfatase
LLSADAPEVLSGRRPNIVLILADDMGFSDLACYGGEIKTPHLDKLAAQGLSFSQFYNCGRCCPSRASLMTGLYPHQTGFGLMVQNKHLPGYTGDLSSNCVTIAEALKLGGYSTGMAGKWHLTPPKLESKHNWPVQRGFDSFFGTIDGAGSYFEPETLTEGNETIEAGKSFYYTDAITDHASKFIESQAKAPSPFFLYVAYTAPHYPLHALPGDIEQYRQQYNDGWDRTREARYHRMVASGLIKKEWKFSPRDPHVPPWEEARYREWESRRMAVYAAQVASMDRGIGRILDAIDQAAIAENTLVLFLSDNGGNLEEITPAGSGHEFVPKTTLDGKPIRVGNDPSVLPGAADTYESYGLPWGNVSNTPFRYYKHFAHEGGIATPLIVRWPSVIKQHGAWTNQVGHVMDLLATFIDLGGVQYPATHHGHEIIPLEGKSLAPIFHGRQREGHGSLYWEHEGNSAMREGDWKLVSRATEYWELHNMRTDRTEMVNLVDNYPQRVQRMAVMYEAWAKRVGVVPWPLPGAPHEQIEYLRRDG